MLNFIIEWLVEFFIAEFLFSRKYWWITCLALLVVALVVLCCYHRA